MPGMQQLCISGGNYTLLCPEKKKFFTTVENSHDQQQRDSCNLNSQYTPSVSAFQAVTFIAYLSAISV